MPPGFMPMITPSLSVELIYSFVIIVCSLMIYFGTRELYELSSHKGIKYFRHAFLFFAVAYFFRSFLKFILVALKLNFVLEISPMSMSILALLVFMYASSISVFYLLYSVLWKKISHKYGILIFHVLAILITFISVFSRSLWFIFWIHILMFGFLAIAVYAAKQKSGKNGLYAIYVLVFGFWALNIIEFIIPNFFKTIQLLIYMASCFLFLLILYKVVKKAGGN